MYQALPLVDQTSKLFILAAWAHNASPHLNRRLRVHNPRIGFINFSSGVSP
jgi:hypothetical protein